MAIQKTLIEEKSENKPENKLDNKNNTKAHQLAEKQRDIGVAEFFSRNRHLLGFDNKRKALMTTIKEAVDNSLDACEEAGILPDIIVEVTDMENDRFRIVIEDNGPGIVKKQIPKIFAKLLYGSKFHTLKQSRGQQGIGISAAVMYSQLTTGRATKIKSKISKDHDAHYYELKLDTHKNKPDIIKEGDIKWEGKDHGIRIEMDIEASYAGGNQSIDEYLKQTAITNPHVAIIYLPPKGNQIMFDRAIEENPTEPKEIKPHPYGVELGVLMELLKTSEHKTLQSFLVNEFSRVSVSTAKQICENAAILPNTRSNTMTRESAEKLIKGIQETKIMNPSTDCISPIGDENLEKGLKKEVNAEFYCATTRPPSVYRGNPFIVEAAFAYGGLQEKDSPANIIRYANRVPLLYQQGACATTKAIINTAWRSYGINQSRGAIPYGPLTVIISISSVWVPFTSESKEAIAHYPEILKEIKLALQECGRKLAMYVNKKKRIADESQKRSYIETFIPYVSDTLKEILSLKEGSNDDMNNKLVKILEKKRGELKDLNFDPTKNAEYDEDFANIGGFNEMKDVDVEEESNGKEKTDNENSENENKDNNNKKKKEVKE